MNRTYEFRKEITKRGRPPTPPHTLREEFSKISATLLADLSKMKVFLQRTFPKYVNAVVYNPTYTTRRAVVAANAATDNITSQGREEFDDTMIAFLRKCKQKLQEMEHIATRDPSQNKIHSYHRQQIAQDLEQRLQQLATAYEHMIQYAASETMRVSMTLDMGVSPSPDLAGLRKRRKTRKRWATVAAENIETKGVVVQEESKQVLLHHERARGSSFSSTAAATSTASTPSAAAPTALLPSTSVLTQPHQQQSSSSPLISGDLTNDYLQQESAMLERNLSTKLDATKLLEKQFLELASMTKMFTAHVEEQHDQVQTISDDTVDALDSVESGLKELNKAKTGTSKYFLCFVFLLLSCIVLFLDWWSY